MNAFVQGGEQYLLPTVRGRGPFGRGRAETWDWPANAVEVSPEDLRSASPDVVVLQRLEELELVRRWTGRDPGVDLPAVYLEHNTPPAPMTRHALADQDLVPIVHVTHFNRMVWDNGIAPTAVIEHGVPDPGHRYRRTVPHTAAVINEAERRGAAVGADLLPTLAQDFPVDLFGMKATSMSSARIHGHDDLSQDELLRQLPHRIAYVHPFRWTSLGLSLIEAMLLGMPVVALDTTETSRAVPSEAGVVSNDLAELIDAIAMLASDARSAIEMGAAAREAALLHYPLERFLEKWDSQLSALL